MSYTKTNWTNDRAPAINATNLNKIENGISSNDTRITALEANEVDATGVTSGYVPTANGNNGWTWQAQQGGGGGGSTVTVAQGAWTGGELVGTITVDGTAKGLYVPELAVTSTTNANTLTISGTKSGSATSLSLTGNYGNATTSAAGLMSATDKSHLEAVYADYSSALTALGVS